jgi:cytochrome c-type biogenesis protein CcmH
MMAALRIFAVLCLVLIAPVRAQAPAQPLPAISPELDQRLKVLETELRCLVCQNQTLADSPAGLADDLRREIRTLALAGKNNAEIKEFLQARYGDFILYRPPVKSSTWLLWAGPFALLLVGGIVFAIIIRRRGGVAEPDHSTGSEAARKLLDE